MSNVLDNFGPTIVRFRIRKYVHGRDCDGPIVFCDHKMQNVKPQCLRDILGDSLMAYGKCESDLNVAGDGYTQAKFTFRADDDEGFRASEISVTEFSSQTETPCDCDTCV